MMKSSGVRGVSISEIWKIIILNITYLTAIT